MMATSKPTYLLNISNAWLLTHTESQACMHIPMHLTHRLALLNWSSGQNFFHPDVRRCRSDVRKLAAR